MNINTYVLVHSIRTYTYALQFYSVLRGKEGNYCHNFPASYTQSDFELNRSRLLMCESFLLGLYKYTSILYVMMIV